MLLLIDNYDSFTWNVAQYLAELGAEVEVARNDTLSIEEIEKLAPERLVISPGPCTPDKAGRSLEVVRHFAGRIPMFGICLGCQTLAQAFGADIVHAKQVMHGKVSSIHHQGKGALRDLPSPFIATRYHSLVVKQESLPDCLEVTAWSCDEQGAREEIMALRHRELDVEGVQFHPESIVSEHGKDLLAHVLGLKSAPSELVPGGSIKEIIDRNSPQQQALRQSSVAGAHRFKLDLEALKERFENAS